MTLFLSSYMSQLIGPPAIGRKMQKIAIFENFPKSRKFRKNRQKSVKIDFLKNVKFRRNFVEKKYFFVNKSLLQ